MKALQVRDCPDDLYRELRSEAQDQNRSIAQQMLTILQGYFNGEARGRANSGNIPETHAQRAARKKLVLEELDSMPPFEIPAEYGDAATLVSRSREERC